ncbi:mannitol dehydrogenase family protein [Fusibacter sp. 3D3]|uniref:mannitol dehydrogenase family protein n=1 Tax=Fusibacter sp. 3D3 TaxID=1048380 RepID=UPI0008531D56|nr:mannitol dehydrogenase family protein [Fusibacter sp. 3D3]GAU75585.1 D-mannonate oxidoreductase [Fusibacter sp. 3D3]
MKLDLENLADREIWQRAGFNLPKFDIEKVKVNTIANPVWIHFGAGNIFRAFTANVQQNILNQGKSDKGIIVAEGFDYEIVDKMYKPHDNLSVLVTLKSDGSIEKTVVGSIVESLIVDTQNTAQWHRLKAIFTNKSLQMVSFTITEKGYSLVDSKGDYVTSVAQDFSNGPKAPISYIGKLVALLYERYLCDKAPIALVSMDNMAHNGTKLYNAVHTFAQKWVEKGFAESGFETYVNDPKSVGFPWSMIDKITPRPDQSVRAMLLKDGFEDVEDVVTSKNTFVAPFVNAEEMEYLVIEDQFPNGRPNLEVGGVIFTDRETVDKVEKMKVCTCLNPLHTTLAIFGCLLDFKLVSEEMKDSELRALVDQIGYVEGLPVVVNPGIIDPKQFIDEVLNVRIPNPFMPDTPQRIATDTSQKLGIRFGETIKAYIKSESLSIKDLKLIPLVFAGWCRYLMGVDDFGNEMPLSSDPLLEDVTAHISLIKLGDQGSFHGSLKPILSNASIFGIDLYEVGLGELVEGYFREMVSGKGAVRETLKKYI